MRKTNSEKGKISKMEKNDYDVDLKKADKKINTIKLGWSYTEILKDKQTTEN